ncbi:MAG: hypothetical protein ABR577_18810 [Pyrinomonadaceae bacterium]
MYLRKLKASTQKRSSLYCGAGTGKPLATLSGSLTRLTKAMFRGAQR